MPSTGFASPLHIFNFYGFWSGRWGCWKWFIWEGTYPPKLYPKASEGTWIHRVCICMHMYACIYCTATTRVYIYNVLNPMINHPPNHQHGWYFSQSPVMVVVYGISFFIQYCNMYINIHCICIYVYIYVYIHIYIWRVPKMGEPPNHPEKRILHAINHPFRSPMTRHRLLCRGRLRSKT